MPDAKIFVISNAETAMCQQSTNTAVYDQGGTENPVGVFYR